MKRLTALAILALVFVFAANNSFSADRATKEGEMSIFWEFNGLSDISVDNSYLGFLYLFADNMGLWVDLGLGFLSSKAYDGADELSTNGFEFDLGFIYYMYHKGNVAFYISPQFGLYSQKQITAKTPVEVSKTTSQFSAGVSFGAEWWAWENVSISFSTYLGFTSQKVKSETGSSSSEATQTYFGTGDINNHGGKIILSYYFN
jgi:hypothetical protein